MGNNVDCGGSGLLYLLFLCVYRLKTDIKSVVLSMPVMWGNPVRN